MVPDEVSTLASASSMSSSQSLSTPSQTSCAEGLMEDEVSSQSSFDVAYPLGTVQVTMVLSMFPCVSASASS